MGGVGELLITGGLVIALFLVWQLWWTGIDAVDRATAVREEFETTQVASPMRAGKHYTQDPPPVAAVGYGETIGMLIVPDWYGVTNNNMPILEGTGADVLDQAAAGHYEHTQQVGEVGNFAIAGHRRTNGNSFRRIDLLEPGDEVIVATTDTWYVYVVTDYQVVEPDDVDVIAPVPGDPTATPTQRTLTLTTCHSLSVGEWGNDHRWITHATLSYWMPRSEGRPESVLNDPEVN
ncbi:class E sortase [Actinomyces sp. W5033]|uniref:class E sortase n=1 Tax=Actinomyces sp. W5033 TaxID=3446479 RepID=UPI003EE260F2